MRRRLTSALVLAFVSVTRARVRLGLGTSIGGGDSFSILRTLNEAYKAQQLQQFSLAMEQTLYLATPGSARALDLDARRANYLSGLRCKSKVVIRIFSTP